jgi:hypothetical protein
MRYGLVFILIGLLQVGCAACAPSPQAASPDESEAQAVSQDATVVKPRTLRIKSDAFAALLARESATTPPPDGPIIATVSLTAPVDSAFVSDRLVLKVVQIGDEIWIERSGGIGGVHEWIGPLGTNAAARALDVSPAALASGLSPDA